jgi:hypothetical protein
LELQSPRSKVQSPKSLSDAKAVQQGQTLECEDPEAEN